MVDEAEYFEAGDSTDGESEELDDLIFKAGSSQHLWLSSESDDTAKDIDFLHNKLKQKDESLNLAAKIGKKLLRSTNNLTIQNEQLRNEIEDLREELNQMKYSQTPRGRSFLVCEESDDGNLDEDVDEGTSCINQSFGINCSKNIGNNSITTISTSMEETLTLRRQIEQLSVKNNLLRDEVKMLQQQSQEEFQNFKYYYNSEFDQAKKLIQNLEKRIEKGESRLVSFEQEAIVWKQSVKSLANKCIMHETEIDNLHKEISRIKVVQVEDKKAKQQLEKENNELRELIDSLKDRVHQMETSKQPKVLRHVTDSKSPYVDSMSFAQELEKNNFIQKDEKFLTRCHLNSSLSKSSTICQSSTSISNGNFFTKLKHAFLWNHHKLGQPGRPGSNDLDIAINNLNRFEKKQTNSRKNCQKSPGKVTSSQSQLVLNQSNNFLCETDTAPHRTCMPHHKHHRHLTRCKCKVKNINEGLNSVSQDSVDLKNKCLIERLPIMSSSSDKSDCDQIASNHAPTSESQKSSQNLSTVRSRLLQDWTVLGTPDLSKILRKQSGIWVKGSSVNELFIEENFATICGEAETDNNYSNGSSWNIKVEKSSNIGSPKFKLKNVESNENKSDSIMISDNIKESFSLECLPRLFSLQKLSNVESSIANNNISNLSCNENCHLRKNNISRRYETLAPKQTYFHNSHSNLNGLLNCKRSSTLYNSCLDILKHDQSRLKECDVNSAFKSEGEPSNHSGLENIGRMFINNRSISLISVSKSLSNSVSSLFNNSIKGSYTLKCDDTLSGRY